jgi:pre-mRNA-splicing helicase BRR2
VLDVLVSAEELELCQVRTGEDKQLRELAKLLPVPLTEPDFGEARTKAHVLLQLHFSRRKLSPEQRADLDIVLDRAPALLQAMVDIISSSGWLRPALAAMELSQMLVQARWNTDSPLLQVPFFDLQTVERCLAAGVKRVEDIAELDEEQIEKVLQLAPEQMAQAAEFCNAYPAVEMSFALQSSTVSAGSAVDVAVTLERVADADDEQAGSDDALGKVIAPFFPKPKLEQYWLVIGDPEANALLSIKKITLGRKATPTLQFDAPKEAGSRELKLYLMCDSVQGADQVVSLRLDIQPGDGTHSDDSSDSGADDGQAET